MNADQAGKAREFIGWMIDAATALPQDKDEDSRRAAEMALELQMAWFYVAQFETELLKGADPYDALMTTACGDTPINRTPSQQTLVRLLLARPGPA